MTRRLNHTRAPPGWERWRAARQEPLRGFLRTFMALLRKSKPVFATERYRDRSSIATWVRRIALSAAKCHPSKFERHIRQLERPRRSIWTGRRPGPG